jgi:hypothetical protein
MEREGEDPSSAMEKRGGEKRGSGSGARGGKGGSVHGTRSSWGPQT